MTPCSRCGTNHLQTGACPGTAGSRVGALLDGKYRLVRLLGEGGMGEVYEGQHTKIGRRVAVKFLYAHFARQPEVAQRFENEAKAAGGMSHENIAAVYDVGALPDGTQFLVMEYLEGEDLHHVLQREGRLPLEQAAELVSQACLGLDLVHRQGIVHRDLKPANLFVTKRANGADLVKVLDFGIAKLRRAEGDVSATKTGAALGTAYYMSPEQARGDRDIGTASDVYALGVILYELLSGQRPHDGDSLLQILHRVLTEPPMPLEQLVPGLPLPLYGIVQKAMAPNVRDRFLSVSLLHAALAPYVLPIGAPSTRHSLLDATRPHSPASLGSPPVSGAPAARAASNSQPSTGSVVVGSKPAAAASAKRRMLWGALGVAVALVTFGGVAARFAPPPDRALTQPAPEVAPVTTHTLAPLPVVSIAPLQPLSNDPAAAPVSLGADASVAQSELPKGRGSESAPHQAPRATPNTEGHVVSPPPSPSRASRPAPKVDCSTLYFYDAKGNRVFKPECIQ